MSLSFYSLSSGSSGNCYYVGNGTYGVLIDAGISASSIRKYLGIAGIPMEKIMGILVTHNHIDHIRGLEVVTRKNSIPAFTTKKIWKSILNPRSKISADCIHEINVMKKFQVGDFEIEAFPVYHDAPETIGFQISYEGKKLTIATDLGHICTIAASYLVSADLLVIESNYDEEMLMNGRYPQFLKARIQSDHGHLGNHQTSSFLAGMMNGKQSNICLAHLSRNNNTPEKAMTALINSFSEKGIILNPDQRITVLNRDIPTDIICLL